MVRFTRALAKRGWPYETASINLVAFGVVVAFALFGGGTRIALAQPAVVDIGSPGGQLTHVYIGADLELQHRPHRTSTETSILEFFPPDSIPGDCGTMIRSAAPCSSRTSIAMSSRKRRTLGNFGTPFTPVSQSLKTGTGTSGDPLQGHDRGRRRAPGHPHH